MGASISGARAGVGQAAGPVWLALAIVATLPLFGFGLRGLAEAWARPEFSHGPVIPALSFYLFLHELKRVPPAGASDRWPGVACIALALALAILGNLLQIADIVFYALIVWTWGLVLTGFGWRRGRAFWPSVLHLVFMLPLPMILYWQVSTGLQFLSSEVGVGLLRAAGVPVYLEGNVIDLGIMKLMVAEACSGLRYLFPIMSFTYVFAVLYRGPLWLKLVLLLAAVPLAVLMNAARIGVIGLLVDRFGPAQATGFLHLFEGWAVFLACIGLLLVMAKAMQWLSGDRRRLGDALDLDFSGLGHELARVRDTEPSRALVAAACLTVALSAAWALAPARAAAPAPRESFDSFPLALDGWSGTPAVLEAGIARRLGADDYLSARLPQPRRGRAGRPVPLLLSQPDRRRGHPLARGLPADRRLGGLGDPPARRGAARRQHHPEPRGDPEGPRPAAGLLLVRGPRPAADRRLRRQVLLHGRQHHPRPHRRRAGAADHPDRPGRGAGGGRRPPAALPGGRHGPPAPLHPGLA